MVLPVLAFCTQIRNTAYIVFDFNTPVQTNTVVNTIGITTSLALNQPTQVLFNIYPNPIKSESELKLVFDAGQDKNALLDIYDMSGRKVFTKIIISSPQSQIVGLPFLSVGVYQCIIEYATGSSHKKFVVMEKN